MRNLKSTIKTAIAAMCLFSVSYSFGQTKADTICAERGHGNLSGCSSTLVWCPPYTEDTDSTTVAVYPCCNTTTCYCDRCGRQVKSHCEETRVVTWRKPKE